MATGPNDFGDPKVSSGTKTANGGNIGRWISIAIAVILVALLLAWILGAFADNDVDTAVVPVENGTTTVAPVDDNAAVVVK